MSNMIDYSAWKRASISSVVRRQLPPVEWMRVSLPWLVDRAQVVSGFIFNISGPDPLVRGVCWALTVDCPWTLSGEAVIAEFDGKDTRGSESVALLDGQEVVAVSAASDQGDDPVFLFSSGWRLAVAPRLDPHPSSDPYWIKTWNETFVYSLPDDRPADVVAYRSGGGFDG